MSASNWKSHDGTPDGQTEKERFDGNRGGQTEKSLDLTTPSLSHAAQAQHHADHVDGVTGNINSMGVFNRAAVNGYSSSNTPSNIGNIVDGRVDFRNNYEFSLGGAVSSFQYDQAQGGASLSDHINARIQEYNRVYQARLQSQRSISQDAIPSQRQPLQNQSNQARLQSQRSTSQDAIPSQRQPLQNQSNQDSITDWASLPPNSFTAVSDHRVREAQADEHDRLRQLLMRSRHPQTDQTSTGQGMISQSFASLNATEGMVLESSNGIETRNVQEVSANDQPLDSLIQELRIGNSNKRQSAMGDGRGQSTIQEGGMGASFDRGRPYYLAIPEPTRHDTRPVICEICNCNLYTSVTAVRIYCQVCGNTQSVQ